jgi:hypothetical protein
MRKKSAIVQVINSAEIKPYAGSDYTICYQWCRYIHADGTVDYGYRFIWKNGKGHLMAHRGQARLPSIAIIQKLIAIAISEGWGNYDGDSGTIDNKAKVA